MQSSLDLEIREWLARYLAGEIPLRAFQEWFVPVVWNVEQSGDRAAEELAHETELRLAEFSNGDWTEQELRRKLLPLVECYTVNMASKMSISSSSVVITSQMAYPGLAAGI